MRSKTRIRPILQLIEEIWSENQDLRLGQLISNAHIDFSTEDVNDAIYKLCTTYNMNFEDYALWGVLLSPSDSDLMSEYGTHNYQRLTTLTTPHLKNILKWLPILANVAIAIVSILNQRNWVMDEDYLYNDDVEEPLEDDVSADADWVCNRADCPCHKILSPHLTDMQELINRLKQEPYAPKNEEVQVNPITQNYSKDSQYKYWEYVKTRYRM